jgi:hypothetical protein
MASSNTETIMATNQFPQPPRSGASSAAEAKRSRPPGASADRPGSDGRSDERARQDQALERAADKEPWITQLLRAFRFSKGRPKPGDRKTGA